MLLKNLTTSQIAALPTLTDVIDDRAARQIQTTVFKSRRLAINDKAEISPNAESAIGRGEELLPETPPRDFSRRRWQRIREVLRIPHLELVDKVVSPFDGFAKYLFAGPDGKRFEAVRIPLLHRPGEEKYIVCVSTQVGCGVGCAFCATGKLGFRRNLETWEIVDQVVKISDDSSYPVRGIVFMGMGEPLLNYSNVINAAKIFSDPCATAIDSKSITISTAGVVPQMRRFSRDNLKYRLITSLHAATDELRNELVPMNRHYPLSGIMDALREYQVLTRRRVMLAWTMIAGVNMDRQQMEALARITSGLKFTLDLIPVNDASGKFRAPSREEVSAFISIIKQTVNCPIALRYSGGRDVQGACGMLAAKTADELAADAVPPQFYYQGASMAPQ